MAVRHDMEEFSGVVVAGAGPVGLTVALALARAEVPVIVLEAGEQLSAESRASTFHPPTLEMLDALGVADELLEIGLKAPRFQYRDRTEGVIAEFDLGVLSEETRFPFRLQCEQSVLTPIALRHLNGRPGASVRFGHRVTGVRRTDDGLAEVTCDTARGPTCLRAPWVIGCDGAHSVVRGSLGLGFDGATYPNRYLVVTTNLELRELIPDLAYVNYVSDPQEWFVLLRTHQEWRALFPVGVDEPEAELLADDVVQAKMQGVARRRDPYPVRHVTLYRVHQRVASTFRSGPALLAGDAAHINNPLGGMGMNSGIHDAYLLSLRLAGVWHGRAEDSALDGWADERRRVCIEHVLKTSDSNFSSMREADPAVRRAHHQELRRLASDPELARAYLLKSSMLETLRAAAA